MADRPNGIIRRQTFFFIFQLSTCHTTYGHVSCYITYSYHARARKSRWLGFSTDDGQTKRNISTPSLRCSGGRQTKWDNSTPSFWTIKIFERRTDRTIWIFRSNHIQTHICLFESLMADRPNGIIRRQTFSSFSNFLHVIRRMVACRVTSPFPHMSVLRKVEGWDFWRTMCRPKRLFRRPRFVALVADRPNGIIRRQAFEENSFFTEDRHTN